LFNENGILVLGFTLYASVNALMSSGDTQDFIKGPNSVFKR